MLEGLCEVKHRMTRRCDGWDYRARAIYQITLVQADRQRPLPTLGGVGAFAALGNRFLLDRLLVQVQVSRRAFAYRREPKAGGGLKIARDAAGAPCVAQASAAFAATCDALLARARQGAVLLSPCVSEGEREVARRAFAEGLPLVVLRNKGFAPLEKPSGRHFGAGGRRRGRNQLSRRHVRRGRGVGAGGGGHEGGKERP